MKWWYILAILSLFSVSVQAEPDRMLDPQRVLNPGADPEADWAQRLMSGDNEAAWRAFVGELRKGSPRISLENSIPELRKRWFGVAINDMGSFNFDADAILEQRYGGVYGIEHQFDGEIDWLHDPSEGRTGEWLWQFNRHLHWLNLADAYRATGDPRYAQAWESELRSWIAQCPRPQDNGNRVGSAWRTLDTGIRAGSTWPYTFEAFRQSPHVSDEALWMFVCAQRENALHLLAHPTGGNWIVMETNGLGHVGMTLPELNGSDQFVASARLRAREELDTQFYPDGTHQEFAPHYAAAGCLANFYALALLGEHTGHPFPKEFWQDLANIVSALARIADPNGITPALHNSRPVALGGIYQQFQSGFGGQYLPEPPWLGKGADWVPWGGYAVLRSENHYLLFDAGPRGTAHFHDDDLQVLSFAHGYHFAVDGGSPQYTRDQLSRHLRTSAAHNVVQMDGKLHKPANEIHRPEAPADMIFEERENRVISAAGRELIQTEDNRNKFIHERTVIDLGEIGWLIYDHLQAADEEPHFWEWLWNLDVDRLEVSGDSAIAQHTNGPQMHFHFYSPVKFQLKVSKGELEPAVRGWMARADEGTYAAIPCLRIISESTPEPVQLFTLKEPAPTGNTPAKATMTVKSSSPNTWNIKITHPNHKDQKITLPKKLKQADTHF